MSTNLFLTEGGVAGHMSHLYDNRDLTFAKLKEIFNAASSGELEGTEKTDGQNLFISYSVKDGKARAARNKGNIKAGGMTAEELAEKFAGRGGLTEAFTESFETFEKAVQSLDPETQVEIFGPDTNVYYNAEIMDPRSPNVVNYDTKSLVIHRAGHGEFDKETGTKTDRDVSGNAKVLDAALERMQEATAAEDYTIHINAIRQLEALSDDKALNIALEALSALQSAAGVSDDATITEYLIARIAPMVASLVPEADEETQKKIIGRLMKSGLAFNQVVQGLDKELKEKIRAIIKDEKNILVKAIQPLESVVHDFSVEMIRGLESAFILDNKKEIDRLRGEISKAIHSIETSGDEKEIEIMMRQMEKLKDVENFATASEGFVFDYDGKTYKFTGNFAPANQILGIAKYGRGGGPTTVMKEEVGKYDVAIFPGAFKPPHRGHLALVDELANQANKVIVLMSDKTRKFVTSEMAKELWDMYLKDRSNVELRVVKGSPVSIAYDFVENPGFDKGGAHITVLAGVGAKGSDPKRFEKSLQGYARGDVIVDVIGDEDMVGMEAITDVNGEPLSATVMRGAIQDGDVETFRSYLPDELQGEAESVMKSLTPKENVTENLVQQFRQEAGSQKCNIYDKRDNCGPAVLDFISWAESKGIKGLKRIDGFFKADIPVSLKKDFTREMKQQFLKDGGNWDSAEERFEWVSNSQYAEQWKYIPHYWVEDTNGKIYDPVGQQQFIDKGYAKDLNPDRYTLSDIQETVSEMIDRMINEEMNEMSAMGAGAVAGYAGVAKKPKKKKKKRIFTEEDDIYIEKIANMVIDKIRGNKQNDQ